LINNLAFEEEWNMTRHISKFHPAHPVVAPFATAGMLALALTLSGCGGDGATSSSSSSSTSSSSSSSGGTTTTAKLSDLMVSSELLTPVTTKSCTLSDGTSSTCYSFQVDEMPNAHSIGPWCPTSDAAPGGYFVDDVANLKNPSGKDEEVQVTVAWLKTLDSRLGWSIVNADGSVNITTDAELDKIATQEVNNWTYAQAETSGIVNHCIQAAPTAKTMTIEIPATPKVASSNTAVTSLPGAGIALDGILLFPPEPVARITAFRNLAPLDSYGGHTGFAYDYHYHRARDVPGVPDAKTKIYGFMFDGFPVYGATEPDGSAAGTLDNCQGHSTTALGYHYHSSNSFPYTTVCVTGAVASSMKRTG
jgi:hypothetical protein